MFNATCKHVWGQIDAIRDTCVAMTSKPRDTDTFAEESNSVLVHVWNKSYFLSSLKLKKMLNFVILFVSNLLPPGPN